MAVSVTYLEFLGVALLPPIAALLVHQRARLPTDLGRRQLPLLVAVAVVYTAPWDRQLIVDHVWSYPSGQVIGATLLDVPLEEYAFYVLQVTLVALVATALWTHLWRGAR